jgi:molybdopterin converting factor subunit 1
VRVTVRLFARLRELAGAGELYVDVADGATVGDVWAALTALHPDLAPYASAMSCAVNEEYARLVTGVHDKDDVAFLPPVSGGAEAGNA